MVIAKNKTRINATLPDSLLEAIDGAVEAKRDKIAELTGKRSDSSYSRSDLIQTAVEDYLDNMTGDNMKLEDFKQEFSRLTIDEGLDPEQAYGEMVDKYGDADAIFDQLDDDLHNTTAQADAWDAFQDWFTGIQ